MFAEQFDADATIAAIERERITHIMLVPTQIIAILASKQYRPERLASLECIVSLGAPLLQEHKDRLNATCRIDSTSCTAAPKAFVTILDRDEAGRKSGSVGRPTQYFDVRIVDAEGRDLPTGEIGEIVGRGPIAMQGYYKRPDLTAQAMRDGWIFSGDWVTSTRRAISTSWIEERHDRLGRDEGLPEGCGRSRRAPSGDPGSRSVRRSA